MDEIKQGRNHFTFYRSYYDAVQALPKAKRLSYYEAVIRYALDETMPEEADSVVMAMFFITKPTLDSGRKKAESCAKGGKASAGVKKHGRDGDGDDEDGVSVEDGNTEDGVSVGDSNSNIDNTKNKNKKNNINKNINTEINAKRKTEAETEDKHKAHAGAGWNPPVAGQGVPCSPLKDMGGFWHYGQYGYVGLKSEEYRELQSELGRDECLRCISFVDFQIYRSELRFPLEDYMAEVRLCSREKRYLPALEEFWRKDENRTA